MLYIALVQSLQHSCEQRENTMTESVTKSSSHDPMKAELWIIMGGIVACGLLVGELSGSLWAGLLGMIVAISLVTFVERQVERFLPDAD
ncbi:hypothetical protein KJ819_01565 [Patescibacteria group bacterium]|nr:hypothetical protein [Patescibacteria group bacterium]MBU1501028.1 hypothetical protein [Patescibacteria group bacterium]MBU2080658.1 hypothetical protein [Patescibacteria group bacterium]MBU2124267.1 hypothetical protein [Patescibacteria group bacterium]MBU2194393.1 hypothetical protein [Patescibacteria group bacterium]